MGLSLYYLKVSWTTAEPKHRNIFKTSSKTSNRASVFKWDSHYSEATCPYHNPHKYIIEYILPNIHTSSINIHKAQKWK